MNKQWQEFLPLKVTVISCNYFRTGSSPPLAPSPVTCRHSWRSSTKTPERLASFSSSYFLVFSSSNFIVTFQSIRCGRKVEFGSGKNNHGNTNRLKLGIFGNWIWILECFSSLFVYMLAEFSWQITQPFTIWMHGQTTNRRRLKLGM